VYVCIHVCMYVFKCVGVYGCMYVCMLFVGIQDRTLDMYIYIY